MSKKVKVKKPAKRAKVAAPKVLNGVTAEQNGVRAPIKGVCRDVWDALDKLRADSVEPTSRHVSEMVAKRKWNQNNASIELSRWRKYHGLKRPVTLPSGEGQAI